MANPHTQMTCERIDDDEVRVRLTNLGLDCDGDKIEDIEIRLAFYEDTDRLEIGIETQADSTITAELRRAGDIVLRFDDVPNPFGSEAQMKCNDCCAGCDPCCVCGTAAVVCTENCDCECNREGCPCNDTRNCHRHCECHPADRCCDCDAADREEW